MDELTKKQKGFVKDYIETDNATEAAERNYDVKNRNVANNIGAENLAKPSIIKAIQSIADKIPDELLEKVHLEGLAAGHTVYKNNNATKKVEEVGYEADYAVRHKYLDSAYKLKGTYAPEKKDITTMGEKLPNTDLDKLAEVMSEQLRQEKI